MSSFRLAPLLTDEQLKTIDDAALRILSETGVAVPHSEVLDVLRSKKGIEVDGEIVRFEPSLVKKNIKGTEGCKEYLTPVIAGAYSVNYLEPSADKPRYANKDDLIRSIKQADALDMGVCGPVVPLDVPGPQQEIVMERLTHEYARHSYGAGQATSAAAAEASYQMHKALGRSNSLELWVNSPLKLDSKGLGIIWKLRHLKPNIRVVNVAVQGQSAPIFLSGLLAQSSAECFAGMAVMHLLDMGGAVNYRHDAFGCYSVDMQSGTVLCNGPVYLQLSILRTELARHNGIVRPSAKALLTQAKQPGIQATLEKASQSVVMEMANAYCHMAAGALATDGIFSPLQLMIDHEILSWIEAAARPICVSEEDLSLDIIAEVGPGGSFFDHMSTVQHMREVIWKPELLSQNSLCNWLNEGMPTVMEKAHDQLSSLELSEEPVVSPDIQKELQKIEQYFLAKI